MLRKLLNTKTIIMDEPQKSHEVKLYTQYSKIEYELPSHKRDTIFDPKKYS